MAADGSPATKSLKWPRYDRCDQKGVFLLDKAEIAKLDFEECPFWGKVWMKLAGEDLPHLAGKNGHDSACQ